MGCRVGACHRVALRDRCGGTASRHRQQGSRIAADPRTAAERPAQHRCRLLPDQPAKPSDGVLQLGPGVRSDCQRAVRRTLPVIAAHRLGSWEDAVAAYHSATPALGVPYRQLVYANWSTPEGWQHALAAAPNLSPPPREVANALKVFSVGGHEVRVWTPSVSGRAAAVVAIAGTGAAPLPQIVTPGR